MENCNKKIGADRPVMISGAKYIEGFDVFGEQDCSRG